MSTMTRPRRTETILPREEIAPDPFATVPDVRLAFRVRSQSNQDCWYRTGFDYASGQWDCDCLAGQHNTRCKHVATCEWWTRYDAARQWIARLTLVDLIDYDHMIARAERGLDAGWIGIEVDRAVVGDLLGARLPRSGVSLAQAREELFG